MRDKFMRMTTALHAPDDQHPQIVSGERVLLIEPGRRFHDLGRAIITFVGHRPIIIEILRTSNCKVKDIPLADSVLFGCHDDKGVMEKMREQDEEMDFGDEVTIIRFRLSEAD